MKNFFTIIGLISFLLLGCNQTKEKTVQKENREKAIQDSIVSLKTEQLQIEKAKQDSLIVIEQEKAIGTIQFGMRKKIVESKIKEFKKENRKPHKIMNKTFYDYFIGNFEFSFIRDFYYQDKLYKIKIIGKPILWDNFDSEASRELKAISDILKAKYGNPNAHYDLEPRYKLKKNYTYLINSWSIGSKEIQVRISDQGTSYYVHLIITKPEIENKIKDELKEKEKQETIKGTDAF